MTKKKIFFYAWIMKKCESLNSLNIFFDVFKQYLFETAHSITLMHDIHFLYFYLCHIVIFRYTFIRLIYIIYTNFGILSIIIFKLWFTWLSYLLFISIKFSFYGIIYNKNNRNSKNFLNFWTVGQVISKQKMKKKFFFSSVYWGWGERETLLV